MNTSGWRARTWVLAATAEDIRRSGSRTLAEINPDGAPRAGLQVSSPLLNLATVVRESR